MAILRFIGMYLAAEVRASQGRADMVLQSPRHVFVIEMKVASGNAANKAAAESALAQIHAKGYADPYRSGSAQVHLLGLVFDCLTHNIGAWVSEELEKRSLISICCVCTC